MGIYLLSTACSKSYVEFQKSLKDRYISVPVKKLAKFASVSSFFPLDTSSPFLFSHAKIPDHYIEKTPPSQSSLTNSAEDTREKSAKLRGWLDPKSCTKPHHFTWGHMLDHHLGGFPKKHTSSGRCSWQLHLQPSPIERKENDLKETCREFCSSR